MPLTRQISNVQLFPLEYFSGADVELYLDGIRVAEIAAISYQVSEQLLPIYGYASRTFDAMSQGSRMASGQLMIPYTDSKGLMAHIERTVESLPSDSHEAITVPSPKALRSEIRSMAKNYQKRLWTGNEKETGEPSFFPNKPFSITTRFGDDPSKDRILVDVYLQSMGHGTDPSGEVILENYAFKARDVKSG